MGDVFPKTESDLNLEQRNLATLKAIKGTQFGKDVYSSVIRFQDLGNFLEIFPSVQRDINPRKVGSLRRYILSGLEKDNTVKMRFFSAVTVTCRGNIFYSDSDSRMAIDTYSSKLSINDGQHRFEAIRTTIEHLEKEFVKSKYKHKTARIKDWIDKLNEMVVPVVIFDGLTESEEKQLFHDLNNLSQRPSRNANIRLNQTDLFSRMARELAQENRYLIHYGVEFDKMSILGKNTNTILLSTVYSSIKEILGAEYKYNHGFLNEDNYQQFKDIVEETLNKLFYALPPDLNIKGKYLTDKSFTIKALTRFICHARTHLDLQLTDDEIFRIISDMDLTYNIKFWSLYGGIEGTNGNIVFGGGTSGGLKAIYGALVDKASVLNSSRQKDASNA